MKQVVLLFGLFLCWSSCQNDGGPTQYSPDALSEPEMKSYARDTANSSPNLAQIDSLRNRESAGDTLTQIGKELNEPKVWNGMFRYMADAAFFTSCEDGIKYTVDGGKGYIDLERAYLSLEPDGKPFYVSFRATIIKIGRSKAIKIDEFVSIKTLNHCP